MLLYKTLKKAVKNISFFTAFFVNKMLYAFEAFMKMGALH